MKKTISMLKDESGIALMMAIFTVTMLMVIATEVMYETNVELVVSSQAVNQLKAHYAAKAGVEISLLRIQIFRKAAALVGDAIPASTLDPIWQTPFTWPPMVPKETSTVDKGEIQKAVKSSMMQGQYVATIESEGSKIDINDLDSPSKVIAASTRAQILEIFQSKMDGDEAFAQNHRGDDFTQIVDNITDWIDADKTGRGKTGGDESALYPDTKSDYIPPNAPFKTLEELHMVAGMTDEIFEILKTRITVYGTKGVNVNYAKKDVLMSLSPQITDERADKIVEDRGKKERGPFKDQDDFVQYLGTIGVQGNPFQDKEGKATIPLIFDAEFNFRIRSTGQSGRVQKEITAIVYDTDQVTARLKDFLSQQKPAAAQPANPATDPNAPGISPEEKAKREAAQPQGGATGGKKTKAKPKVPTAPPNIVYWNET
jgi:general secretion pathway protein K